MKILHSVCSLLKWKYLPSRAWSSVGKGETIHNFIVGQCRNLSSYGNSETTSISKLSSGFGKASFTQRLWAKRPDEQLFDCMVVISRSFNIQHSVMMTDTDEANPGRKSIIDNAEVTERIENEVKEISKSVLEKMEETEKIGYDSKIIVVACVRHLYSLRLSKTQIQYFLAENKHVYEHKNFIPITIFLYRNGLNGRRTCKLVSKFPEVLDLTIDEIREKIEHLRDIGFISADILLVLEGLPEVLQLPTKTITRRISDLQLLFKSKDVLDLIKKSPSILVEDLAVIMEKFNYVFHTMGITQRQIMYSSLFKHSLSYIRQRHAFLVRSGFYRARVRKGELNPNPLLEDIVDITTRVFLQKYGKMPMSDYNAFCELFERETRNAEENELDEDSDAEETDYDSDDEQTHKWKR